MSSRLKWIVLIAAAALLCANAAYADARLSVDVVEPTGSCAKPERTEIGGVKAWYGAFGAEPTNEGANRALREACPESAVEAEPEPAVEAQPEAMGDDRDLSEPEESSDAEESAHAENDGADYENSGEDE